MISQENISVDFDRFHKACDQVAYNVFESFHVIMAELKKAQDDVERATGSRSNLLRTGPGIWKKITDAYICTDSVFDKDKTVQKAIIETLRLHKIEVIDHNDTEGLMCTEDDDKWRTFTIDNMGTW